MVLPVPAVDVELPHGFTIRGVNGLAVAVTKKRLRIKEAYDAERLVDYSHAVRAAILESLYQAEEPPTYEDLLSVGARAFRSYLHSENRFRGITREKESQELRINNGYRTYWRSTSEATRSPEQTIVEHMAMRQILETLRPSHREVLEALAEHHYYGHAAEALGKSRQTFTTQVSAARQAFLRHWHEGERPSRAWGHDRRALPGNTRRETATYIIRRRLRQNRGDNSAAPTPSD